MVATNSCEMKVKQRSKLDGSLEKIPENFQRLLKIS